ncbi:MAG TPA: hypothetical protein VFA63_05930 [Pseudonocardiaceae bacterium]|nr:hypothetical protein [Pseudonocardiaceae bacterium]
MSETPIYDQLRGERLNADVPADSAARQPVSHRGQHHLPAAALGWPEATGRPAWSGSRPAADPQYSAVVDQAVQAALSAARRARFMAGTRATRRPAAHARHRLTPAGGDPGPPADQPSSPAPGTAAFSWFERPA